MNERNVVISIIWLAFHLALLWIIMDAILENELLIISNYNLNLKYSNLQQKLLNVVIWTK